jgi:lipopolysaccharide export system permease protein
VGAPLGAIVKKGGFGAPVVIAALLFMVYFILISVGESLANEGVVSPFWGMWMATFILAPVAILLTRSAANDSKIFSKESWTKLFGRKRKKTIKNESTASLK